MLLAFLVNQTRWLEGRGRKTWIWVKEEHLRRAACDEIVSPDEAWRLVSYLNAGAVIEFRKYTSKKGALRARIRVNQDGRFRPLIEKYRSGAILIGKGGRQG